MANTFQLVGQLVLIVGSDPDDGVDIVIGSASVPYSIANLAIALSSPNQTVNPNTFVGIQPGAMVPAASTIKYVVNTATLVLTAQGVAAGVYNGVNDLPAGFTPLTVQLNYSGGIQNVDLGFISFFDGTDAGANANCIFTVFFDLMTTMRVLSAGNNSYFTPPASFVDGRYPGASAIDLFNNGYGFEFVDNDFPDENLLSLDYLNITGTYEIVQQQTTIPPITVQNTLPVQAGDPITINDTSGTLEGVSSIILTPATGSPITVPFDSYYIITQIPNQLVFYLPIGFGTYTGPLTITLVGNGIEFSGSVTAGTVTVSFADGSGIYVLQDNQPYDDLYLRTQITTIQELFLQLDEDLSNSFAIKSEENSDFYSQLTYPRAVLAQSEEDELDSFSLIGALSNATLTNTVPIPSPFIKTSFLPPA
jgi:hypothetical protein